MYLLKAWLVATVISNPSVVIERPYELHHTELYHERLSQCQVEGIFTLSRLEYLGEDLTDLDPFNTFEYDGRYECVEIDSIPE